MMIRNLKIDPRDNVVVALEDAKAGDSILYNAEAITVLNDVPFAHKIALVDLAKGDKIYKYGQEIGFALENIQRGGWIHIHNMGCERGRVARRNDKKLTSVGK
jgi:altronate dehydratase